MSSVDPKLNLSVETTALLDEIFKAIDNEDDTNLYSLLPIIPDIDAIHPTLHIGVIHSASAIPCTKFARGLFRNLVKWKTDVNAATGEGFTPLDIAVANDRFQTAKFLLKNGAQPTDRTLDLAQEFNSSQCEKLIRESLATVATGYDTDVLVKELKKLGLNPGPITKTTKPLYLRYVDRHLAGGGPTPSHPAGSVTKVFSPELEFLLSKETTAELQSSLDKYDQLDEALAQFFLSKSTAQSRTCFTYLLLDSQVTANLPKRKSQMKPLELFRTFLEAVFYIGKGTNARPYAHLHEAKVSMEKSLRPKSEKTRKILSLWNSGMGVICLSAFRNVSSDEALAHEAAMITTLDLSNLTNEIDSKFPRELKWSGRDRSRWGAALLWRCFRIHMSEGERPLLHTHIT